MLPESSPHRAKVEGLLARAEIPVATLPAPVDAEAAVVDLTTDAGQAALESLLKTSSGARLSVIALVEPTVEQTERMGVADFLSPSMLEQELLPRLARARARSLTYRQAVQRERETQVLLELTAQYAGSSDVEALLHDVTRRLAEELEIDRAALVVLDESRNGGIIVAASDDPALKDLRIDLARYPEIREASRTGKPVIVEDAPSHPLLEDVKETVAKTGIRNIAAFPLTVSKKVLGVILVRRSGKRGAFVSREIDFLSTVAHATAIALRNAQRIASLRGETAKEKEARIAAESRAQQLQRFASYFDDLSDGVAILDEKACVISLNPAGLKLLDLTPSDANGRHVNALFNPTDDAVMLDMLLSVSRGETRRDVDLPARTQAGRPLTVAISASPVKSESGVAILVFRDVTKARTLADELQKTTDFLERLIDSSVDAIIAADMKGRIILFNKAAEEICGWQGVQAKQHLNVRNLYPNEEARNVMTRLREKGGRLAATRQDILHRSGELIPVSMTASIVYENGRETATLGIFTDLRDRLKLERKLSDVETRLEESEKNAVLVALAGTAAHELNQPLTSVMGYAELLKRKIKEGEAAHQYVDIIYREADRIKEIVRKIGKITKYETKPYVGNQEIIDLTRASSHEE